jgi:hypothetical protein
MITGAVMHRVMLERQPITEAWADTIVDVIVGGLRARLSRRSARSGSP